MKMMKAKMKSLVVVSDEAEGEVKRDGDIDTTCPSKPHNQG